MQWTELPQGSPGAGEVRLRHRAVGVNFIDIYHRSGLYPPASVPFTPGIEGAGVVEAVGEGVQGFSVGDRVAYGKGLPGAYMEERIVPEADLIKLPEEISCEYAAASLLKGLTAHFLLRRTFNVTEQTTLLITAAAGGVGLILCQWAKTLGATVIGTVGSEEKAELAKQHGCDVPVLYKEENIVERVREATGGEGCNVVYDSVGRDTLMQSLDCLMPFGLLVSFGQSSGAVPPIDPKLLMERGSLFFTRPSLFHYKQSPVEYLAGAGELFELMKNGAVTTHIGQTFYLSDAASAHRALEAGKTTGSTILLP